MGLGLSKRCMVDGLVILFGSHCVVGGWVVPDIPPAPAGTMEVIARSDRQRESVATCEVYLAS